jgi:hypothetical protein
MNTSNKIDLGEVNPGISEALETFGNGLAFGAGPAVSGALNVAETALKKAYKKKSLFDSKAIKEYKEAYKRARERTKGDIESFEFVNPKTAVALNIAGSVPTTMAIPVGNVARGASLGRKVWAGAKGGAAFGAAQKTGEAVNKIDKDYNIGKLNKDLMGIGEGAVSGGVLGSAGGLLTGALLKGKLSRFIKDVGKEKIKEALKRNVSLLENADEKILQKATDIRVRGNSKARQTFADFERKMEKEQKNKIDKIIDEHISKINYPKRFKDVQTAESRIYTPLYEKAMQAGNVERIATKDSKVLPIYINKARKYSDELRNLKDNDINVLQRAKEELDDDIQTAITRGKLNRERVLRKLKEKVYEDIDNTVIPHKAARQSYSKMKRYQDNMKWGLNEFAKIKPEKLEDAATEVTKENLIPRRIGAAQYFRSRNFSQQNPGNNAFQKVFPEDDVNRLEVLKLMKPNEVEKLKEAIYEGQKGLENIHRLTGGSQTPEKLFDADTNNPVRVIVTPKRKFLGFTDTLWRKLRHLGDEKEAKYLTNIDLLKEALRREPTRPHKLGSSFSRLLGKILP